MSNDTDGLGQAIAVIGMAGRFPGAANLDAYWQTIVEGRDNITRNEDLRATIPTGPHAPDARLHIAARGVLAGVEQFDPGFFDFSPAEAAHVDPQHRLWLELAYEALEQSGYAHDRHKQVISVFAGSFLSSYLHGHLLPTRSALEEFLRLHSAHSFALMVQNDPAFLPSRSAYKLGLRGPAINVQAGCSTSLVAITLAVQNLMSFESDIALAGGVCIALPQNCGYYYQEGAITSRDGYCRPYDAKASGTVFGSGGGAVVLKRLAEAERDGDPIFAVLRGAALNNDGHSKVSYLAPSVTGQAEVITAALGLAEVEPDTIGYVEGHGTATAMGDPIEVEALTRAFRRQTDKKGFCCLGSAKGNVGHLDAAAGVAGFIRAVLALRHRVLPPTAHFFSPNPDMRLSDSPFFVLSEARDWPGGLQHRRAGVSSFGIGGTNAHVVLEEYSAQRNAAAVKDSPVTLHLSTKGAASLDMATANLLAYLEKRHAESPDAIHLPSIDATLTQRRQTYPQRRTIFVQSTEDALLALKSPGRWDTGTALPAHPKIFFAFPGQGSLRIEILSDLCSQDWRFGNMLDELARPASRLLDFDVAAFCRSAAGLAEIVQNDNAKTQVILFCVSVALARCLMDRGIKPDAYFGHSLGEWPAAHLSGQLSLEDALSAVFHRGRLMTATGRGAALSIKLPERELAPLLPDGASLACVNGASLCLVSGRPEAIDDLARALGKAGISYRPVPIDVAVHSPIMDPAVAPFAEVLSRLAWSSPKEPMLSSVTGGWLPSDAEANRRYFSEQLRTQVRFDRLLSTLAQEPTCLVIEVGIGNTITSLVSAGLADRTRFRAIPLIPAGKSGVESAYALDRVAGRLWANGLGQPHGTASQEVPAVPDLPPYPFDRRRCWIDPPAASTDHRVDNSTAAADATRPTDAADQITALVAEMSGLSAEVLDRDKVLSEMGFESLFLVELAERLSSEMSVSVDYARLSECNSIARLARYVEEQQAELSPTANRLSPAPAEQPCRSEEFRGLITLRKGDGRLPLLFIHGDQANDMLPRYLPEGQALYGYVHQGSNGEPIRMRSVETLAARCLAEWMAAYGDAPCVLAGHSYGGQVAYHLAYLLRQRGVKVSHLYLIDTLHPRVFRHLYGFGPKWCLTIARIAWNRTKDLAEIGRAEAYLRRGERVPAELRSRYIVSSYELGLLQYFPPRLDIETTLFAASTNRSDLPLNGYRPQDVPRLREVQIDGDHLGIVRDDAAFNPIAEIICTGLKRLRDAQP